MKRSTVLVAALAFALGALTTLIAKSKTPFDPNAYYAGKEPKAAAAALLAQAEVAAGNGSWERLGVARVYYLSGDKAKAKTIFDGVLNSPKVAQSDIFRAANYYAIGKDWETAKALFEKGMKLDADDDRLALTAGCWYNLNGDRKRAEELFNMAFAADPTNSWHYALAGGSYVGVEPF